VTGLAHTWFGGPGAPRPVKKYECEARVFLRHPDMRIVGLYKKKTSPQSRVLEPTTSRP